LGGWTGQVGTFAAVSKTVSFPEGAGVKADVETGGNVPLAHADDDDRNRSE
jgi:hypothetical protein